MARQTRKTRRNARSAARTALEPAPSDGLCCCPKECAVFMKELADVNRLKIVRCLVAGPRNVKTVAEETGLNPHRVSHHLGRLRLAGLVEAERQGRAIIYRITPRIGRPWGLDVGCAKIVFRAVGS